LGPSSRYSHNQASLPSGVGVAADFAGLALHIAALAINETRLKAAVSVAYPLERNGFFGPDSWYMNSDANAAFAERAKKNWRLTMPVLFLHGAYDYTCETIESPLPEPMRAHCSISEATRRFPGAVIFKPAMQATNLRSCEAETQAWFLMANFRNGHVLNR
jgi:hypothetical protein